MLITALLVIAVMAVLTLVALALNAARLRRLQARREAGELTETPESIEDRECCGQHETCEKDSLLAAVSRGIEYYDDEELDRFRGRDGCEYTEEEEEEFREVLFTMKNDEVAGWVRSLQLRGIELPDGVKDEVFLIVGERRMSGHERQ